MIQKSDQSDFHLFQSQNTSRELDQGNSFGLFAPGKFTGLGQFPQIGTENNLVGEMQPEIDDSTFQVPPEFESLLHKRPFPFDNNSATPSNDSDRFSNQNNHVNNFGYQNNNGNHHINDHDTNDNYYEKKIKVEKEQDISDFESLLLNAADESDINLPYDDSWKNQSFTSDDFAKQ